MFASEFINNNQELVNRLVGEGPHWSGSLAQAALFLHAGIQRKNADFQDLPATNIPPDMVIVLATTAIPYSFALKSALDNAFGTHCKTPPFIYADVSDRRINWKYVDEDFLPEHACRDELDSAEIIRLHSLGLLYHGLSNTAVFDDWTQSGLQKKKADEILRRAGFKNTSYMIGKWGLRNSFLLTPEDRIIYREETNRIQRRVRRQNTERARNVLQDMKRIGVLMAEEIKRHNS